MSKYWRSILTDASAPVVPPQPDELVEQELYVAIRAAADHARRVVAGRPHLLKYEQIGIFITSLRQQLFAHSIRNDVDVNYLCNRETWSDIGVLATAKTPYAVYGRAGFVAHRWSEKDRKYRRYTAKWHKVGPPGYEEVMLDNQKAKFVAEQAMKNNGQDTRAEIATSFSNLQRSLQELRLATEQAHNINVESDHVVQGLVRVAESVEPHEADTGV